MVDAVRRSNVLVDARTRAGYIGLLGEIPDEGGKGQDWVYPVTTAFSSLNPGIGGIDSVIAVAGVHKVKPCSEGTSSHEER